MTKNPRHVLIAAAWPYANGSLHLGHVAALLGADVLARYHRAAGDHVAFVSGADAHGTPIQVAAEKQGISAQAIAKKYFDEYTETLGTLTHPTGLCFTYDNFTTTTTANHAAVVQEIFRDLYNKKLIYAQEQELPYCENDKKFLADRYIEGECPHCHFADARGDQCDNCGKLLDAKELIAPRCKICGQSPIWRTTSHFFLKLSAFTDQLTKWITAAEGWRPNAKQFSLNFIAQGLQDRAITRDIELGVPLPKDIDIDRKEEKRIYVWFEAVCGYLSATKEWAEKNNQPAAWHDFWDLTAQPFHYYVHGKDNIPFHTMIWPAILLGTEQYHLPDRIVSSEYLTLEKKKFSTSRDWAVWLPDYLAKYEADALRYYLISNGPEVADADFSWKEYQARTNNELVANLGNFVNRTLVLIQKNFPGGVALPSKKSAAISEIETQIAETFQQVGAEIAAGNFRKALQQVFRLSERGNRFLNETEPWQTIKTDPQTTAGNLAVAAGIIANLAPLIDPFVPQAAKKIAEALALTNYQAWEQNRTAQFMVKEVKPLFRKIADEEVAAELARLEK